MSLDQEQYDGPNPVRVGVLILAGIIVLILMFGFITGLKKTPRDQIGLSYGGGPFEGAHFQRIVEPGHGIFFNGLHDRLYQYPVTQRSYIISKKAFEGDRQSVDFIQAASKDSIPIDWEVATYFKLNLDKVQLFHEQIGLKYKAWTDSGWLTMLHESFRQQIEASLQREARKYDAVSLFSNQDTLAQVQKDVGSVLQEQITGVFGENYFCGPTYSSGGPCPDFSFVVKHIDLPEGVKAALQRNKQSPIDVQTKLNEVKQKQAEAQAIEALQRALRNAATSDTYVQLQWLEALKLAISSGKINFWVLPSDGNFTFQTPKQGE